MASKINLRDNKGNSEEDERLRKEENLMTIKEIFNRSKMKISTVGNEVRMSFKKFVELVQNKDVSSISGKKEKDEVVVSADLLADITNAQPAAQKETLSANAVSGIFVYGAFVGVIVSLLISIIVALTGTEVSAGALTIILIVFVVFALAPIAMVVGDPYVRKFQEKNKLFLEKVMKILNVK